MNNNGIILAMYFDKQSGKRFHSNGKSLIDGGIMRLEDHPILNFNRGEEIEFYFEGKIMKAYLGETIAAALHANGIKVLSHSTKDHSPRGLYCAIGNCSSCLMTVNKIPNVRVCVELIEAGDDVRVQNGMGDLL
jgi:hypothetical protein